MGEPRGLSLLRGELTQLRQWSRKSLFFAALTCTIRPTAAITWVFLYGALVWQLRHDLRAVGRVLIQVSYIGFVVDPAHNIPPALTA